MKPTPTFLLLEAKLGEPLAEFVRRLRKDERTWDYIARTLRTRTSNTVRFSTEALRKWFADEDLARV